MLLSTNPTGVLLKAKVRTVVSPDFSAEAAAVMVTVGTSVSMLIVVLSPVPSLPASSL